MQRELEVEYYFAKNYKKAHSINYGITEFRFKLASGTNNSKVIPNVSWMNRMHSKLSRHFVTYRKYRHAQYAEYRAKNIGFEPELMKLTDAKILQGYFQTYKFADLIKEDLMSNFEVNIASEAYKKLANLMVEIQPTVMHIRGGDYRDNQKKIGMLGKEYYFKALNQLKHRNAQSKLWVFSDDESYCNKMLHDLNLQPDQAIFSSSGLSDAETLKIMSLSSGIVMSNSTFSWWAAYLNSRNAIVICPQKWFRGMDDPNDLLPSSWVKCESIWSE